MYRRIFDAQNSLDPKSLLMLRIQCENKCTHRLTAEESEKTGHEDKPSLLLPLERTPVCYSTVSCDPKKDDRSWNVGGKQIVECILLCLNAIDKMAVLYKPFRAAHSGQRRAVVLIVLPDRKRWARDLLVRYCESRNLCFCLEPASRRGWDKTDPDMPVLVLAPDYEHNERFSWPSQLLRKSGFHLIMQSGSS